MRALPRRFGHRVGGAGDDVGVVAGAAGHVVLARAALQSVVAGAAVEIVVAGFAQQQVVAVAAVQCVVAGAAEQAVVAVAAVERIGAAQAHQHVVAGGAAQHVGVVVAIDGVGKLVAGEVDGAGEGRRRRHDLDMGAGRQRVVQVVNTRSSVPSPAASMMTSVRLSTMYQSLPVPPAMSFWPAPP